MRSRQKPADQVKIAKERIAMLFNHAEQSAKKGRIEYANRYIHLARKIGMRYNVRLPSNYRRRFCRQCKKYLCNGVSSEETQEKGFLKIKCLNCSRVMRYKLKEYIAS
ncbi:MAG: ribonuclease P [Candidatus Aenigmarchaeota archaeon]|nr:ribonuclease P [Candidatus Aenigmarchaeota archaeon]